MRLTLSYIGVAHPSSSCDDLSQTNKHLQQRPRAYGLAVSTFQPFTAITKYDVINLPETEAIEV